MGFADAISKYAPRGDNARFRMSATACANWVLLAAVCLVAVPTLSRFATMFWSQPDDTHEPVVLAGVLAGFWCERTHFGWHAGIWRSRLAPLVAVLGMALYALGRAQAFYQLEGLGLLGFLTGCLMLATDKSALPRMALLVVLCLFLVPVPGTMVDGALLPLKLFLTENLVRLLAWFNLPIASHGVVVSVGFYQLQIANACAGLRSMLALTAIGLLFIYFVPSKYRISNVVLIAMIPCIALVANFCRLLLLVLLTYYFGAAISEQAHDVAGYAEIAVTLVLFTATRLIVNRALDWRHAAKVAHA